jgi:membrane-bound serine protease (ClpP class)
MSGADRRPPAMNPDMSDSTALLGFLLLIAGIALIIAEIVLPTVGVLGVLGILAVIISAFVIHAASVPGTEIIIPIVAGIAVVGGLVVIGTGYLARKSLRQPVVTGAQGMIGATAEVVTGFSDKGTVQFGGEIWKARTQSPLNAGQSVRIVKVDGLVLWVEPT